MSYARSLAAALSAVVIGCGKGPSAEVRILPRSYEVGAVKSELATPIVDELVRIKVGYVLVITCTATPPEKVIQFERELRARIQPEMQLSFSKACES